MSQRHMNPIDDLTAWRDRRDESAFARLVDRHAPMVAAICRRRLGEGQDADEAMQATFIILAKRAGTIRDPQRLGPWLHRVAIGVCQHAHRAAQRRAVHERAAMTAASPERGDADTDWEELRPQLDAAIADLSPAQREVVIGHFLEGLSYTAVAARLDIQEDAVRMRLGYALKKLHAWFARRRVAIPLAALAVGLAGEAGAAEPGIAAACTQAALLARAGAGATVLARQAMRSADAVRAAWIAACAAMVAVSGVVAWQVLGSAPPPPVTAAAPAAREPVRLVGHTVDGIESLAFSPDGRRLLSSGKDGTARLWEIAVRTSTTILKGPRPGGTQAAMAVDGRLIATADAERRIQLWDAVSGRPGACLDGHVRTIRCLRFSPDGRVLASGSDDFQVRLWAVPSGRCLATLHGRGGELRALAFSPDGTVLAVGGNDSQITLWQVASGDQLAAFPTSANTASLAFAPDGAALAVMDYAGRLSLLDPQTGSVRISVSAHGDDRSAVVYTADGRVLVTAGSDQSVASWDARTLAPCRRVPIPCSATTLAIAPDGAAVAVGGWNTDIFLVPSTAFLPDQP